MAAIKTIGILTSGGDAPGMNAAIRAVTRSAIFSGFKVKGIYRGYKGLIDDEVVEFKTQNVSNIIQQGGTILKTARSKEFPTPEGHQKAYEVMKKEEIDALVVIGGDGSLSGARQFASEYDVPIIGLPGTIDNDLYGTDHTIGYDTALNTIMWCVDRIRDTATSHERLFFIEVMGRNSQRCRGGHHPRDFHRGRPACRTHSEWLPQEQELIDSACGREPHHRRRHGPGRACAQGVSAI